MFRWVNVGDKPLTIFRYHKEKAEPNAEFTIAAGDPFEGSTMSYNYGVLGFDAINPVQDRNEVQDFYNKQASRQNFRGDGSGVAPQSAFEPQTGESAPAPVSNASGGFTPAQIPGGTEVDPASIPEQPASETSEHRPPADQEDPAAT